MLSRLRDGDRDALGELMAVYWEPLTAYVVRMLGCPDAAEDIVQETFVRLWERRAGLTPDGSVRALLHEIARNLALKRVRHQGVRRRKTFELREVFRRPVKTPLEQAMTKEARHVLTEAIEALPARRREAFVLVRYQGLSLEEAAQVMDVSKQTVANHAVLAMKQLRSLLRQYQNQ